MVEGLCRTVAASEELQMFVFTFAVNDQFSPPQNTGLFLF